MTLGHRYRRQFGIVLNNLESFSLLVLNKQVSPIDNSHHKFVGYSNKVSDRVTFRYNTRDSRESELLWNVHDINVIL